MFCRYHLGIRSLFFAAACILAFFTLVSCADRRSLALLPLESEGVSPDVVAAVEGALTEGLARRRPVVGPAAVRRQLGPGCSAAECNEATARALHVAELVSGGIQKAGAGWKVTLILRTEKGDLRPAQVAGDDLGKLLEALKKPGLFSD